MPAYPWFVNADNPRWQPGHGLGRREAAVPFRRLLGVGVSVANIVTNVNKRLDINRDYIPRYDQGVEGACVGFAWSWAMSFLNRRFYAARKLYLEAQLIDPWSDTPPEEGTSTVAGAQVLMQQGHWRFARGITFAAAAFEGISGFSQARTVDEMRVAISLGVPIVLGINWYEDFDRPRWMDPGKGGNRWWIGHPGFLNAATMNLGPIRGGHAICCFGARDDIEAFSLVNSWGVNYPVVQIPYVVMQRLLDEGGDAIIPSDRT